MKLGLSMIEQEKTNRLLKKVNSKCPNLETYRYQIFYSTRVRTVSRHIRGKLTWSVADPDPYGMFSGLLDADPDPLVRGAVPAPDPDPSIIKQK